MNRYSIALGKEPPKQIKSKKPTKKIVSHFDTVKKVDILWKERHPEILGTSFIAEVTILDIPMLITYNCLIDDGGDGLELHRDINREQMGAEEFQEEFELLREEISGVAEND